MTQATLNGEVEFTGAGLHTGEEVTVRLKPSEPNKGIVFVRTDLAESPMIPVSTDYVITTERGTTVGRGEVAIHTVEHLLATLSGLEIDNVIVEFDGAEVPTIDGSSMPFLEGIKKVGIKRFNVPQKTFRVREPVWLEEGDKQIIVLPSADFKISYSIHFPGTGIGSQFYTVTIDPESFEKQIAPARTFCSIDEVEYLRNAGLIKGGSLNNSIVFDAKGPYEGCKLRFPDEPVRHKILDLIGDFTFLGARLKGHVIVIRGGHTINIRMARKLEELRQKTVAYFHRSLPVANEQLDIQAIKKILPHRHPFLLVDRILSIEPGKKVVGLKNVTGNEDFFVGHYPQYPVMPGVLIIEAMAQVGGVMLLSATDKPGRLVFFSGLDEVKFRKPVVPGDQVIFEVEAVKVKSKMAQMRGKAFVEGAVVAEAELKFIIPEE